MSHYAKTMRSSSFGIMIEGYAKIGLIADSKTQNFLEVKMQELFHVQEMLVKMDGKSQKNAKANQEKLLNRKLEDLLGFVEGKLGENILSPAREVLIQSLKYVKI